MLAGVYLFTKIPISLKRTYSAFRAKLGETGHGLIVAGQEDKIVTGTPISNVFGMSLVTHISILYVTLS